MLNGKFVINYSLLVMGVASFVIVLSCQAFAPEKPGLRAGSIKWQYETGFTNRDEGAPAISADGTIYLVAKGKLHAVVDTGDEGQAKSGQWPFGGMTRYDDYTRPGLQYRDITVSGVPVVTVDERVLVPAVRRDTIWEDSNGNGDVEGGEIFVEIKHMLYALKGTGDISWAVENMQLLYPPATTIAGTIFAVIDNSPHGTDPKLVKYSISGNLQGYEVDLDFAGKIRASPAVGPDGYVYIMGGEETRKSDLYRLDLRAEDSSQWVVGEWHVELRGVVRKSLAIDDDGTVYLAAGDYLQAIRADQTEKWAVRVDTDFYSSPALGETGQLYIGGDDGMLYGLNTADGGKLWDPQPTQGAMIESSPAVGGGDGMIYIGANCGNLWAFNPDGTGEDWFNPIGGKLPGSPVIGDNGTLYMAASDGFLYAIHTDSTDLAHSDWPMYRCNAYHTNSKLGLPDINEWNTVYRHLFRMKSDVSLVRRYRDEYLLDKSGSGRVYVQRLYEQSEEALALLAGNPELMEDVQWLMEQNREALAEVLKGKSAEIKNVEAVFSFMDKMSTHSSGSLKDLFMDVKHEMQERRRLDKSFLGFNLNESR